MPGLLSGLSVRPGLRAGPDRHSSVGGTEPKPAVGTRVPWFFDPWLIPRATVLGIVLVVPLVFDPSRDEVFAPIKATVLQAGLGFGLVMAAIALLRHRPSVRSVPVADMAVAGFVAWYLVGYVFSIDRSVGLHGEFPEYQGLSTTVAYTGLYLVARLCFTEPAHLQRLFVVLSVVTAAVGGYALLQRLGLDPLWGVATRPFSTVGQANSMAATLLVGLPAAVATAVARKGIPRILAWTAVVLGFFGLLTSLSRGGWLGMMAAAVVVLLFQKPRRRRSILLAALTTSAVLALLLAPSSPGRSLGQDARERLAASTSGEGSVSKHLTLWKLGAVITIDRPWTGVGPQVFPQVALRYADEELTERDYANVRPYWNESPHNGLLSISTDAGVPASVAYLVFLTAIGIRAARATHAGQALAVPVLAVLAGYVVSSQFMTPEMSSSTAVWGLLGAACGTIPTRPPPSETAPAMGS